ncbi:MAG: hypothetical protein AUH43_02210 [Acidobacteria bacterium 13_1_40CM_65_14]|jgi:hypothetical protein|nr:MAG: hypothetical protein AUH43_02210 [Acidobacteria bacterium 13_1_40CM_65_14]OLD14179.1 MAG: hypothetical protein AUJ01_14250 [Acidobacteria bacterium 13_1_40CM_3_65_5]OLE85663.1 MAG: hypothetical protein AUF76_00080 [Acidobacteria bacterium 13_1_20CM_2_65_9]
MRTIVMLLALGAIVSFGCGGGPQPPPFKPVADVKQLMQGAIDPSADVIWEATGTIISKDGVLERRPKNQAEWDTVRNAAIMLTESGNLLMMSPRAKDGDVWMKRSQEMIDTGVAAWKAAEAKNVDQLFTIGGDVYEACSHCHQEYMDAIKNANK